MENQRKNPDTKLNPSPEELKKEVGSNLTGTARPATADEKELIAHHTNKSAKHVQNTDALLGNIKS
jgi:hypothetical protein